MRHMPTAGEYAAAPTMTDGERRDYFLTRVFETDEVWFLKAPPRLFEREVDGCRTFPVWPYRRFASEAALEVWQDCVPSAVSLEHFLDVLLQEPHGRGVLVEIMPRGEAVGCLISAARLKDILVGMMDAGEYRLDG